MRTTAQLAAEATRVWELLYVQREGIPPSREWRGVAVCLLVFLLVFFSVVTLFSDHVCG